MPKRGRRFYSRRRRARSSARRRYRHPTQARPNAFGAPAGVAAGAWSHLLARQLGEKIPLETERGYNTTLPSGAFDIKRQLIFSGHGFVVTPLATGIRVGGAVELGGLDRTPNYARSKAMLRRRNNSCPGSKTKGGRQWMGFRPSLPDSLPVVGRSRDHADVVYAFGHGHLGLTQSAATGKACPRSCARRGTGDRPFTLLAATVLIRSKGAMARHSFHCIDGHTCGNPVRLVAGGGPLLDGKTMMERRAHFLAEYDWIRTGLMFEPRGHDMMPARSSIRRRATTATSESCSSRHRAACLCAATAPSAR